MIERIVSGGQTGVDQAALDFAISRQIPHGGWCPKGRKSEAGKIPSQYKLAECAGGYEMRTRLNVQDSDGTLLLWRGQMGRGTKLTWRCIEELGRPWFAVNLMFPQTVGNFWHWVKQFEIRELNVAGTRESNDPGVHDRAVEYLEFLWRNRNDN